MVNVNEVLDINNLKKAVNYLVGRYDLAVKVTKEDGDYYIFAFEKDVGHYEEETGCIVAQKYTLSEFVSLARMGMIMSKSRVRDYAEGLSAKIKFF